MCFVSDMRIRCYLLHVRISNILNIKAISSFILVKEVCLYINVDLLLNLLSHILLYKLY